MLPEVLHVPTRRTEYAESFVLDQSHRNPFQHGAHCTLGHQTRVEIALGQEIDDLRDDAAGNEHAARAADHGEIADHAAEQGAESEHGFACERITCARCRADRGRIHRDDRQAGKRAKPGMDVHEARTRQQLLGADMGVPLGLHPAQQLDLAFVAGSECGHAGLGRKHHDLLAVRNADSRSQAGARADHEHIALARCFHFRGQQKRFTRVEAGRAMRRGLEVVDHMQITQHQVIAQVGQRNVPGQVGIDDFIAEHHAGAGDHHAVIAIVGALFFIFGFVTWLNGPLIQFAKLAFNVDDRLAFLIPSAFYLSYFFLALPSSAILRRTGMKKGMAFGLLVMAVGAVVFGHFTTGRVYAGAVSGVFIIGAGLALLQTASNPYISILGPIESAAQRIAVMGICNKIAGMLAPIVIGNLVMHGLGDLSAQVESADAAQRAALLDAFAARIHTPYMVMAGLLALLSVGILYSPLPELRAEEVNSESAEGGQRQSLMQYPHAWLGALCIFMYVGAEVMAGDAIGTYGAGFQLPLDQTKFFTSFTLGAMLAGYLAGLVLIPRFVSQERWLSISAVLGLLLVFAAFATQGMVSVYFVAALGFANAMMWPAIFPLAIQGLGRFTEKGSALLIMGISGGAVIPQLFVHLKESMNFQLVFLILMVPCYLYILHFALRGHRIGR